MKETIDDQGLSVYEFEDSELCDKFYLAIIKSDAEKYVIERMIDGVSQSLLRNLQSGAIGDKDSTGSDSNSAGNVLKIVAKFIANLVFEGELDRKSIWALAHEGGLPDDDSDWTFNVRTRQFSRKT
jgi:hypothetical protein